MARLIRVASLAASRRRAGFAFTREAMVIGAESLGTGKEAMARLAAIVSDPGLVVTRSDEDTPDTFVPVTAEEREAFADIAIAVELANDDEEAEKAIERIVEGLIGKTDDAGDVAKAEEDRLTAEAAKAEEDRLTAEAAKAEEDRLAAEAADKEPAKEVPAPVEAKAKTVAKPARSSGRKPAAATTGAAKG